MIKRILKYPALRALLAQLAAALLTLALLQLYWAVAASLAAESAARPLPLWLLGVLQGLLAAGLGQWAGLSRWWLAINGLFVPGLLVVNSQALPLWLWPSALLLLALLFGNSLKERVPLYLSGAASRRQLVALLGTQPANFALIDLGCGFAGALCQLARHYPRARLVGVETAPLVFLLAWLRCLSQPNCHIQFRSLWHVDLAEYQVVYCFLSPVPMPALWRKAQAQMRPGALLVSNTFAVPGVAAERVIELHDWRHSRLLIWQPAGLGDNGATAAPGRPIPQTLD
jgi:hypothetical protein